MPWVRRSDERYFYQSVRLNSRTTPRYLGSGEPAEQAAAKIEKPQP